MRLSAVAFLMILTTVFLSGCTQQKTASIEDHHDGFYGRVAAQHSTAAMTATAAPVPQVSVAPVTKATAQTPTIINTKPVAAAQPVTVTASAQQTAWQWPVDGKVTQTFGNQKNGTASEGITIAAADGAPIHAAQAGEVAFVGHNIRDYGNIVILRHGNGTLTSYAHARDISVAKGDKVAAGQVIATVGQSGNAKTPQLHFALRSGDRAVDPLTRLPQRVASN